MTARILVVDDLEPNVKLLEAKLSAEYFDVVTAMNGPDAIEIARAEQPDIVLLDVMMPGMDGYEVCRRLKAEVETAHIPVVMVSALDQQSDRVVGLEAGADDFLTKPVEDLALFARVRGLTRLKIMTDELRQRYETGQELGLLPIVSENGVADTRRGRIALLSDEPTEIELFRDIVDVDFDLTAVLDDDPHLTRLRAEDYDIFVVDLGLESQDSLRLVSQLRSFDDTRFTPLLGLVRSGDMRRLVRALDMGVNDYVSRPIDANELLARLRTQYRRKVSLDRMRSAYHQSLELAVTDQLTNLSNRRYLQTRMPEIIVRAREAGETVGVLVIDIDHFKEINDRYGHDAGDVVLSAFGRCLATNVRNVDLACRYGGEEFVVVAPNTDAEAARDLAERLRKVLSVVQVKDPETEAEITFTVSIGVAVAEPESDQDAAAAISEADKALLDAKRGGRNQVRMAGDSPKQAA